MPKLYLYNTLTRRKEEFKSIKKNQVGLYTCGPTVYNYAHLGNLRTYIFEDILKRVLIYNGFIVKRVMNITDVGHLVGDRDMGKDKLEETAKKEGKNAWAIADFYWSAFKNDMQKLNLLPPDIWCKATDNITAQIALIKKLEKNGYTYHTSDGIYFNTAKFKNYTKLSRLKLEELKEGARVEKNDEKKNPTDFALWKFSPEDSQRQMEWPSPWGTGFPGWHIECSTMSMKYLKDQLDIHCGGIDHINVHHTNEIAQSEAANGKKFFNYWLHGAFLNIAGGKKMAKSADNFLTLDNALVKKNLNSLSYRYACLQVHYRKPMEYSATAMHAASSGLNKLYQTILTLGRASDQVDKNFQAQFLAAVNDDLNLPQALAVTHNLLKSTLPPTDKLATLLDFDQVLGLNFAKIKPETTAPGKEIKKLADERLVARQEKNFKLADELRKKIVELGFTIEDTPTSYKIKKARFKMHAL